jgi:hypothetical protein
MNFKSLFGLGNAESGSAPENMARRPVNPEREVVVSSPGPTGGDSLDRHELTKAEKSELKVTVLPPPPPPPPPKSEDGLEKFRQRPYLQVVTKKVRYGPDQTALVPLNVSVSEEFIRRVCSRMREPAMSPAEFAEYRGIHAKMVEGQESLSHLTDKAARSVYQAQLARFSGSDFSKEHVQSADVFELDEIRLDFRRRHNVLLKTIEGISYQGRCFREKIATRVHEAILELALQLDAEERARADDWAVDFGPSQLLNVCAFCATRPAYLIFGQMNHPSEKDGVYALANQLGFWAPPEPPEPSAAQIEAAPAEMEAA